MGVTIGAVLRAARSVRGLSSTETARGAGISPAYLSRLENDAVKRPSPGVLHRLGEVLKVPYSELMTLVGYRVSDADDVADPARLDATIFTDLFVSLACDHRCGYEHPKLPMAYPRD